MTMTSVLICLGIGLHIIAGHTNEYSSMSGSHTEIGSGINEGIIYRK